MAKGFTPLTQEVRKLPHNKGHEISYKGALRWVVLAGIFVLTVVLTSPFYVFRPPAPPQGSRLAEPVVSRAEFRYTSADSLARWESERRRYHKRVYQYIPTARDEVIRKLNEILALVDTLDVETDEPAQMLAAIRRLDSRLSYLAESDVATFVQLLKNPRIRQILNTIVVNAYDNHVIVREYTKFRGLLEDDVVQVGADRANSFAGKRHLLRDPLPLPTDWIAWNRLLQPLGETYLAENEDEGVREIARLLLPAIIQPNLRESADETARALNNYPQGDLSTSYRKGQVLVTPREVDATQGLSAEQAELLREHRRAVLSQHRVRLAGHIAFTFIVFLIVSFYIQKFSREFEFTAYNLILIALPVLIGLAVEAFILLLADGNPSIVGYLFPAGAIGMLGVLLLDVRMALLLVTWGCLLFGLQVDLNYEYVIVGLFGGYTGVAALYSIRKRWEVFVASILIGLVNAAIILITSFIQNPAEIPFGIAGLGFFSGIASFLILAVLPLFERFGIITDMQLLELTGIHHPLLRQTEELAPGTWQHTLNVAKLAEAAATEIGVNYLLVRAGCYFHDIGKVKNPEYFTENQITNEDKMRHEALQPVMSARVIKNHVKEGVEMARAAKLPERIIDFIRQHHGTSTIAYFYHKALELQERGDSKEAVRIDDFRYPGPKPQTIEAAIVHLADTVEATATAKLSGRTVREGEIQQIVRNAILDKFHDGQFDECNLTLRDLNVIRDVFTKVLKSRFHTRIDYPKKPGQRTSKDGQRDSRHDRSRDGENSTEASDIRTTSTSVSKPTSTQG